MPWHVAIYMIHSFDLTGPRHQSKFLQRNVEENNKEAKSRRKPIKKIETKACG
jgi:hypothetical protein